MPNLSDKVYFNLKNLLAPIHDSLACNVYVQHWPPKQVNPAIHHWRVPEFGLSVLTPPAASALSLPSPLTPPNSSTAYIIRQHGTAETHRQLVEAKNVYIYGWLQREAVKQLEAITLAHKESRLKQVPAIRFR